MTQDQNRLTLGFLISEVGPDWGHLTWQGMVDEARVQNVNLICFPVGYVFQSALTGVLYDLIDGERLDGLAIWTASLAITKAEQETLCERYAAMLPVVTLESKFGDLPRVSLDSYAGMRTMLEHLIDVHTYHRIAYLDMFEGHAGFRARYQAYVDALEEHGLPLESRLSRSFTSNEAALTALLADLHQAGAEALIVPQDIDARRVVQNLHAQGLEVPYDIAVVGFNDDVESGLTVPPLTTVRPRFYEFGRRTVKLLLDVLKNRHVAASSAIPARLIVRQSCGCMDVRVRDVASGEAGLPAEGALRDVLTTPKHALRTQIAQAVDMPVGENQAGVTQLLDGLADELFGETEGAFLRVLDAFLRQTRESENVQGEMGYAVEQWHTVLSVLRRYILPYVDATMLRWIEDVWHQARVMVSTASRRAEAYQAWQTVQQAQVLQSLSESLLMSFDFQTFQDVLVSVLPHLDITSAYVALYDTPSQTCEWSRLLLAYDASCEQKLITLDGDAARFLSSRLMPDAVLPQTRPYSFLVQPLYFQDESLGFAVLEIAGEPRAGSVYEVLRGRISNALKGALLWQEHELAADTLRQAYAEVEQQVKERTAELQRETAERERLMAEQAVLQQQVIDAQRETLKELATPVIPLMDQILVLPLIGGIDSERARDIMRSMLAGISEYQARVVILDITGVPMMDTGVISYLNKTIQAAHLKGARVIVTGISEVVAETIVELGIDWREVETLSDLQTGLRVALTRMGLSL